MLPRWWFRKRGPENSDDDVTRTEELTAMVPGGINNAVASECDAIPDTEPLDWQTCRTPRDRTPWQVLQTAECWLMFWSTWVTLGAYGIVALNLAQVRHCNGTFQIYFEKWTWIISRVVLSFSTTPCPQIRSGEPITAFFLRRHSDIVTSKKKQKKKLQGGCDLVALGAPHAGALFFVFLFFPTAAL